MPINTGTKAQVAVLHMSAMDAFLSNAADVKALPVKCAAFKAWDSYAKEMQSFCHLLSAALETIFTWLLDEKPQKENQTS